jgi:hypothetical protein
MKNSSHQGRKVEGVLHKIGAAVRCEIDVPDLKCAREHRTPLSTRYVPLSSTSCPSLLVLFKLGSYARAPPLLPWPSPSTRPPCSFLFRCSAGQRPISHGARPPAIIPSIRRGFAAPRGLGRVPASCSSSRRLPQPRPCRAPSVSRPWSSSARSLLPSSRSSLCAALIRVPASLLPSARPCLSFLVSRLPGMSMSPLASKCPRGFPMASLDLQLQLAESLSIRAMELAQPRPRLAPCCAPPSASLPHGRSRDGHAQRWRRGRRAGPHRPDHREVLRLSSDRTSHFCVLRPRPSSLVGVDLLAGGREFFPVHARASLLGPIVVLHLFTTLGCSLSSPDHAMS